MSHDESSSRHSHVTADTDRVREWGEEYDLVPVRRERAGTREVELVERAAVQPDDEELSWDEFESRMERADEVVVMSGEEHPEFSVMSREDVYGRASVETEVIEEALEAGETVTTQVTETTVVEKTVVEEATLESEVVDRSTLQSTIVDAQLDERTVDHCSVDAPETADAEVNLEQFETGARVTEDLDVEVEVDERWTLVREELEELTVESRVVDSEATETDTLESDTIEETVDVEGVHETILEGELLSSAAGSSVLESGAIESTVREDDVIETTLSERTSVEEQIALRKRFTGRITEGETIDVESTSTEQVDSEIVDAAEYDVLTEGTDPAVDAAVADEATEITGEGVVLSTDDEGKTVVDAEGDEIGMIVEVDAGTGYVEPHPSLTDRIKASLDWGEPHEDAYPLDADQIADVTDQKVRLRLAEE